MSPTIIHGPHAICCLPQNHFDRLAFASVTDYMEADRSKRRRIESQWKPHEPRDVCRQLGMHIIDRSQL